MRRVWGGWLAVGVLALGLVGCDTDADTVINQANTAAADVVIRFHGRVVNQVDRGALNQATVTFCGFGSTQTDSSGSFLFEIAGRVEDITAQRLLIRVDAAGFATREFSFSPEMTQVGHPGLETQGAPASTVGALTTYVGDLGAIGMRTPLSVDVTVGTNAANPAVANARVYAFRDDSTQFFAGPDTSPASCANVIVGTTDANGRVTLSGFDPGNTYRFYFPTQDIDGDGQADYSARWGSWDIDEFSSRFVGLMVSAIDPSASVDLLATSNTSNPEGPVYSGPVATSSPLYRDSEVDQRTVNPDWSFTRSDGSMVLVFDAPVQILNTSTGTSVGPRFVYTDDLRDPVGVSNFPQDATVFAIAVGTVFDTVWTITPNATLPANEVFSLRYNYTRSGQSGVTLASESDIYMPKFTGALTPRLDNYNGSRDGSGGDSSVFLEFDEWVTGRYLVLEIGDGATVLRAGTDLSMTDRPFNYSDSPLFNSESFAYNAEAAPSTGTSTLSTSFGAVAGTHFRTKLVKTTSGGTRTRLDLNDSTTATTRWVKLYIDATDAEGNRYEQEVTLEVE